MAVCKTIVMLEERSETRNFKAFIGPIFELLGDLLNKSMVEDAKRVLRAVVDVASEEATFFRAHLVQVGNVMAQIGNAKQMDDGLQQLCMEALSAIAEGAPGMVRKSKPFIETAVKLSLSLMLEVDDDAEWSQQEENDGMYDNSNFDCGEMSIDRLAQAVEGSKMTPIVFPLIAEFVQNKDWRFRHAGLRALSQVGEVIPFEQIPFRQVVQFLGDEHPRVRYAAINCIGQLASDFSPQLQKRLHDVVIPALLALLQDVAHPRIVAHAAAALFNFVDPCEQADGIVSMYADRILPPLVHLLKTGSKMVQQQVMTTIAAVAGAAPEQFDKFYNDIVPMMKQVIVMANGTQLALLRARAMEAITFIGMAVGKQRFSADAKDVMNIFLKIMQSNKDQTDDVAQQYMLQAWTRICTTLGEEFMHCLPVVIPSVFQKARHNADLHSITIDENDTATPMAQRMSTRGFTSSLEDKAMACCMLCSFVHDLKAAFFPYIEETASIMLPLMSFELSDEVRNYAITCMPDLVMAAVLAMQEGKCDLDYVRRLFAECAKNMIVCFKTDADTQILMCLVGSLNMCVEQVGELARDLLDGQALNAIGEALLKLLTKSGERIEAREKQKQSEDFDEEALAVLVGENQQEDELNYMVSESIGALIKSHHELFLPTFGVLLPELIRMLSQTSTMQSRKIALYIFDDVIENVGLPVAKYYETMFPALLTYVCDNEPELRQASAYGLAMCAQHGGQYFQPYLKDTVNALGQCLMDPRAKSNTFQSATDNVCSALGKIAKYQDQPQLLPMWLSAMPIMVDFDETLCNMEYLCHLMETNNPQVLGANLCNLPKILTIFAHVVLQDSQGDEEHGMHGDYQIQEEPSHAQHAMLQRVAELLNALGQHNILKPAIAALPAEQRNACAAMLRKLLLA